MTDFNLKFNLYSLVRIMSELISYQNNGLPSFDMPLTAKTFAKQWYDTTIFRGPAVAPAHEWPEMIEDNQINHLWTTIVGQLSSARLFHEIRKFMIMDFDSVIKYWGKIGWKLIISKTELI